MDVILNTVLFCCLSPAGPPAQVRYLNVTWLREVGFYSLMSLISFHFIVQIHKQELGIMSISPFLFFFSFISLCEKKQSTPSNTLVTLPAGTGLWISWSHLCWPRNTSHMSMFGNKLNECVLKKYIKREKRY